MDQERGVKTKDGKKGKEISNLKLEKGGSKKLPPFSPPS